jgi:uncharacterized membrane protein required for colicin V production
LIIVVVLAFRGLFRGLLAQALGVVGLLLGLLAGAWITQWVGAHWAGAQPAVIFWTLRWLVAVLAALAVMSLFHVTSDWVCTAVRETPLGGVDRLAGVVAGAVLGLATMSIVLVGALLLPLPSWIHEAAASSRCSRPLIRAGVATCSAARALPGSKTLGRQYVAASRRLGHSSSAI